MNLRRLTPHVVPVLLALVAVAFALTGDGVPRSPVAAGNWAALAVLGVLTALLATFARQSSTAYAVLLLACLWSALRVSRGNGVCTSAAGGFSAFTLCALYLLPPASVRSPAGALRLAAIAVPLALVLVLGHDAGLCTLAARTGFAPAPAGAWMRLPVWVWVVTLTAAALPLVRAPRAIRLPLALAVLCSGLGLEMAIRAGPAWSSQWAVFVPAAMAVALPTYAVLVSLWQQAYADPLTGVRNRRALEHDLFENRKDGAVAMVDIDHFKVVNDRHGHDAGDQILRFVATMLDDAFPGAVYRYGGEEFALLLKSVALAEAVERVDAVRAELAGRPFVLRGADRPAKRSARPNADGGGGTTETSLVVTFSAGVAPLEGAPAAEALETADRALYRAKSEGRNRVCAPRTPRRTKRPA